jgi:hypothetical protein
VVQRTYQGQLWAMHSGYDNLMPIIFWGPYIFFMPSCCNIYFLKNHYDAKKNKKKFLCCINMVNKWKMCYCILKNIERKILQKYESCKNCCTWNECWTHIFNKVSCDYKKIILERTMRTININHKKNDLKSSIL